MADADVPVPNTFAVFLAIVGLKVVGVYEVSDDARPDMPRAVVVVFDDQRALRLDAAGHFRLMTRPELGIEVGGKVQALTEIKANLEALQQVSDAIQKAESVTGAGSLSDEDARKLAAAEALGLNPRGCGARIVKAKPRRVNLIADALDLLTPPVLETPKRAKWRKR